MAEPFWIVLLILAVFLVYVAAKVLAAMRRSERQWDEVDKTKLRSWEDEDDW